MQYPTRDLTKLTAKIIDKLSNDAEIKKYCLEKYQKEPVIYHGFDEKEAKSEELAPMIIVMPGDPAKEEGTESSYSYYNFIVGWIIANSEVKESGNVVEYIGVVQSAQLGQLIINTLAEMFDDGILTDILFRMFPVNWYPLYPGEVHLEYQMPTLVGVDY